MVLRVASSMQLAESSAGKRKGFKMVPKALSKWKKSDWTRANSIASDMPMGDDPQTYMIGSVYVDVGRDGRGGFVGVNSFDSRGRDLRYRRVYIKDVLSRRKRNDPKKSAKKWSFKIQNNPSSGEPEAVATDGWATSYGSLAHSHFDGNYVAWGGSTVPPKYISRAVLARLLRMSEETTAQRTSKLNGAKRASAKRKGRKPSFEVYHTHNGHIVSRHRSEGAAMDARDREATRLSRWRNASHGGNRNAMVGVAVRVV